VPGRARAQQLDLGRLSQRWMTSPSASSIAASVSALNTIPDADAFVST
jgi:hypothetical protein